MSTGTIASSTSNDASNRSSTVKAAWWKHVFVWIVLVAIAPKGLQISARKEFVVHAEGGAVLLTGASSGLGRAACGYLAEGYPRITFYCGVRKPQGFEHPFDLPNVRSIVLDITNSSQIDLILASIQTTEKQDLIGLINNAGISEVGTVEYTPLETVRSVFEVNWFGTIQMTQAALPQLRRSQGRIVTVGSISGRIPGIPLWYAYQSSKYALECFTDALRAELTDYGVSVSLIEPGFLKTKMTRKQSEPFENKISTEERTSYPHLFTAKAERQNTQINSSGEGLESTCRAIEDALFGRYPKTRYKTSFVGPFPSWFFVAFVNSLPDRLVDWLKSNQDIMFALLKLKRYLVSSRFL